MPGTIERVCLRLKFPATWCVVALVSLPARSILAGDFQDEFLKNLLANVGSEMASNATLSIDSGGLEEGLKNPIPKDIEVDAVQQDNQLQHQYSELSDGEKVAKVNKLVASISSRLHNKPGKFTARVLKSNVVNAFTVGGPFIYIFTELLDQVQSDDELAGIIGHELGHVDAGHIPRKIRQAGWIGLGSLAALAAVNGEDRAKVLQGNTAANATFSREYETEADVLGAIAAYHAGYNPRGLASFFERQMQANLFASPNPWLMDHPFDESRKNRIMIVANYLEKKISRQDIADPIILKVLETIDRVEAEKVGVAQPAATQALVQTPPTSESRLLISTGIAPNVTRGNREEIGIESGMSKGEFARRVSLNGAHCEPVIDDVVKPNGESKKVERFQCDFPNDFFYTDRESRKEGWGGLAGFLIPHSIQMTLEKGRYVFVFTGNGLSGYGKVK